MILIAQLFVSIQYFDAKCFIKDWGIRLVTSSVS